MTFGPDLDPNCLPFGHGTNLKNPMDQTQFQCARSSHKCIFIAQFYILSAYGVWRGPQIFPVHILLISGCVKASKRLAHSMALAGISTEKLKKYTTKEDLRLVGKWGLHLVGKWGLVNVGKLSRGHFHINLVSLLEVLMNLLDNFLGIQITIFTFSSNFQICGTIQNPMNYRNMICLAHESKNDKGSVQRCHASQRVLL